MKPSERPRRAAARPAEQRVAARRSPLNGTGLFARTRLPARRKIGELSGTLVRLPAAWATVAGARKIYLVQVSARYALECSDGNDFKFLNHSCEPNCFLRVYRRRVEVYALRSLAAGTELTVDYGQTPHRNGMRCTCGAARCRGVV
ncbi:MAG: SET domain-containing protein-lysine N-methyltransferase [Nevskia sp.]|nr:SET domain-containing protein-lysine N-methyltransferase [Nevskia sp.]